MSSLGVASRGRMLPLASCRKASSKSIDSELTVGATAGSSVERTISNCTKRRGLCDLKVSSGALYSSLQASQSSPTTIVVSIGPFRTFGMLLYFSSVTISPFLS